jgi:hypothetical protein
VAKEVISRCDECGATEGVRQFTITPEGDETKDVDLCAEHAGPVFKVYALGVEEQPKSRGRKARQTHAVVPIEDWEGPVK